MTATLHVIQPHSCGVTVRPCPRTECRMHIEGGPQTCALDTFDEGEHLTISETAERLGITPQAVWQIERRALLKLWMLAMREERECEARILAHGQIQIKDPRFA